MRIRLDQVETLLQDEIAPDSSLFDLYETLGTTSHLENQVRPQVQKVVFDATRHVADRLELEIPRAHLMRLRDPASLPRTRFEVVRLMTDVVLSAIPRGMKCPPGQVPVREEVVLDDGSVDFRWVCR
jgi:hypothetical protein